MIGPPYHLSRRRVFHHGEAFCFMMVLFHIIVILAKGEPCSMKGQQNQAEYDACMSYKPNVEDGFSGDLSSGFVLENAVPRQSLDSVCSHTDLFCFPPRLWGFLFEEKNAQSQVEEVSGVQSDVALPIGSDEENTNISRSSDACIFKFLGGRTVSCYLSYQECYSELPCSCIRRNRANSVSFGEGPLSDDKYKKLKPKAEDETDSFNILGGSSPHVEINPPLLDWGEKYLYFPSLAFLNVKNTHRDRAVTVFEPYGTNFQFYPCNFSETLLAPGETASICFVFLPTWLGISTAQFVLQTSSGGFLVQAKGFAVESPYRIQPLVGLDISSSGMRSKNLSLYNPYNEALHVEEVTIWTSISSGDNTHYAKAICNMNKGEDSNNNFSLLGVKEWLDVKGDEVVIPLLAIRPHRNWEIDPDKTETIIELDFPSHTGGEIFGAFSLQLLRSSKGKADTIIVPLKAELGKTSAHSELTDPLSLSIQTVEPCATDGTSVVALSVRNDSPYIFSIVKVSEAGENIKPFRIRYVEGLILFPGTVTQVAMVTYSSPSVQLLDPLVQAHEMSMNCKLLVSTNDSRASEIEVACRDVVSLCSGGKYDSSIGQEEHSDEVLRGNTRAISSSSSMRSPLEIKAVDTTMADESVLKNWKSHATANGMSVLDESELVFPVIPVGSYHSQWITIENPSQKPILVQLVLNSWEIIDECKTSGSHLQQPSLSSRIVSNYSIAPKRYGFSLAENAVTEALLHPFGKASFGPILFQPAARCQWSSSALVRNNLSGVEWLTLKGSGGLLSLVLLDESEPVQNLDFKLNLPTPLNLSSSGVLYNMKDKFHACSLSLSKELHAKNVGDFPLEVKKIEISGTECGTDGFVINGCKGFSLEPEESIKLVISYHTDFSMATIHRDLELALATGILVIPMKASLPICVLHFCKRSLFWMKVKKLLVTVLFLATLLVLVLWCIIPQLMAFGSHECLPKSGKSYMTSVSHAGKLSRMHTTEKQIGKFVFSFKLNGLLRSFGEGEALLVESFSTCEDIQAVSRNQSVTDQNVNHCAGCNSVSDTHKGTEVSSSTKSIAIQSSDTYETPKAGNLTVKIGKEKGRRRKKKKNSATALFGAFDVSSSHSGNSTPSSPLSPTSNSTPSRPSPQSADMDRPVKLNNPFADVGTSQCKKSTLSEFASERNVSQREATLTYGGKKACPTQEKPVAPKISASKPVLLPSATLSCADKSAPRLMCHQPILASSSVIAPHLRAPGSKPPNQMAVKTDEKMSMEEKFTYDIWGDHLSNLPLVGRSKEVLEMPPRALENSSSSFFLRGPQTLITNYQQITVSSDHEG